MSGVPELEADELQLAIAAAQRKRKELIDAQPAAQQSAKVSAALPQPAQAYKRQIERGLQANPRETNKARVILKYSLGPIQLVPEEDESLWAEFDGRPAALLKRAVGTSVGSDGSGGMISACNPCLGSATRHLVTNKVLIFGAAVLLAIDRVISA